LTDDDAIVEILRAGLDDWIPVDEVLWVSTSGDRSEASKARVGRVLEQLFRGDLMVPGDLAGGFQDWPGGTGEWLARARSELDRFGWRPMGAGFWLRLTQAGEQRCAAE
jgi:hypothetical protein